MEKDNPKKARIALLMNSFWNAGSGGLSGGDQRLIQIFDRIGANYDITIITSLDGRRIIADKIKNADYRISPTFSNRGNIIISYFIRIIWCLSFFCNQKFDYLYGSSDFLPDVLPCFFNRLSHKKTRWVQCIFHYYPDWNQRPGNKLINLLASISQKISFYFIEKRADKVININFQVKERLEKDGIASARIRVNPCGINFDSLSKMDIDKERMTGSFLARLNPSKGIYDLPKIWKEVVTKLPEAKLKIIGGGSEETKKKLQDSVAKLGLDQNVELCGFLADTEAFSIIARSNVFLFPSHEEGFGMAIAEAMACGTPCVAWNLPVYSEVFDGTIITVTENNIQEFAEKVVSVLGDDKNADRLSKAGRKFVERYSWESIAQEENEIIQSMGNK